MCVYIYIYIIGLTARKLRTAAQVKCSSLASVSSHEQGYGFLNLFSCGLCHCDLQRARADSLDVGLAWGGFEGIS